jgi:elongation factor P
MAQLNVTELRNGAIFQEAGQLLQVLSYEHIKMGRGSGVIKVKVKNLKTGSVTERGFQTGARVEDANVEKKKAQFLYKDGDSFNFMDPVSYEQFILGSDIMSDQAKYLLDGLDVVLVVSDDQAIAIELPNSVAYTIEETGPGEKGNTVSNVYKDAKMDNGLIVRVPMFMKEGEKVKVDTRTGEYIERVK